MTDPITRQQQVDASSDAASISAFVNSVASRYLTRLGREGWTLSALETHVLSLLSSNTFYPFASYDAFGDSITNRGYPALIATAMNLTAGATLHSVGGTGVAEQADYLMPVNVGYTNQLFTMMVGMNDQFLTNGGDGNKQRSWAMMHMANIAWLAIPYDKKTVPSSTPASFQGPGAWSASTDYAGDSLKTSTINSYFETTFRGNTFYLAHTVRDGSGGTFQVVIDSVNVMPEVVSSGFEGADVVGNDPARDWGQSLLRFPNLGPGLHTIRLTVTSATDVANVVQVDWWAAIAGDLFVNGPTVVVGEITPRSEDYFWPRINDYNEIIRRNVQLLNSDGLNICVAPTYSHINVDTDFVGSDDIHPNTSPGMDHIMDAFLVAINAAARATTIGGAQIGRRLGNILVPFDGYVAAPCPDYPYQQDSIRIYGHTPSEGNTPVYVDDGGVIQVGTRGGSSAGWSANFKGRCSSGSLYVGRFSGGGVSGIAGNTTVAIFGDSSGFDTASQVHFGDNNSSLSRQFSFASGRDAAGQALGKISLFVSAAANQNPLDPATPGTVVVTIDKTGTLQLPGYGAGTLTTDASGNVTASSDEQLKDIDGPYSKGLAAVLKLSPILYHWNEKSELDRSTQYAGFSAQDVRAVIPEAVFENKFGMLSLSDRPIIAALVNALKELTQRLEAVETQKAKQ